MRACDSITVSSPMTTSPSITQKGPIVADAAISAVADTIAVECTLKTSGPSR